MTASRPHIVRFAPPGGTIRACALQRAKKMVEAKVGFEPTWTALQTVASPHSATSPCVERWAFCGSAVKRQRATHRPRGFTLQCGKIQPHGTHPAGCRQLENARQPDSEPRAAGRYPEGTRPRRRGMRRLRAVSVPCRRAAVAPGDADRVGRAERERAREWRLHGRSGG